MSSSTSRGDDPLSFPIADFPAIYDDAAEYFDYWFWRHNGKSRDSLSAYDQAYYDARQDRFAREAEARIPEDSASREVYELLALVPLIRTRRTLALSARRDRGRLTTAQVSRCGARRRGAGRPRGRRSASSRSSARSGDSGSDGPPGEPPPALAGWHPREAAR